MKHNDVLDAIQQIREDLYEVVAEIYTPEQIDHFLSSGNKAHVPVVISTYTDMQIMQFRPDRNALLDIQNYFSIPEKRVDGTEFSMFWHNLSEAEKVYLRLIDLKD